MQNTRIAPTPLPQEYYPLIYIGLVDPTLQSHYQQVIRSLLYLSLGTCPDIAYAVAALAKQSAPPLQEHLDKTLYICWYLLGTRHYFLVYDGATQAGMIGYANADWGSDPNNCHSQTGWFIKLANCTFSWQSYQQKHTVLSSTEAECVIIWL